MKYINLNYSKIAVSNVGQGMLGIGDPSEYDTPSVNKRIETLEYGLSLGINLIDTGEDYELGNCEKVLAEVVKNKRDKIVISTKFKPENNSNEHIRKSLEGSLKRINTDYIDIYQNQWPNPKVDIRETVETLIDLQQEGKIRAIGIGNLSGKHLQSLVDSDLIKYVDTFQGEYDVFNQHIETNLFGSLKDNNIKLISYGIRGSHLLSGRQKLTVSNLMEKYNCDFRGLKLAFSNRKSISLFSSMNHDHIRTNCDSVDIDLNAEDVEILSSLLKKEVVFVAPNRISIGEVDDADKTQID